jgi:predicted HicB family RNase H-like nuclease
MKKNIEIPDEIKMELQILAVRAGKNLKKYIEDVLTELVKKNRKYK